VPTTSRSAPRAVKALAPRSRPASAARSSVSSQRSPAAEGHGSHDLALARPGSQRALRVAAGEPSASPARA
jgi:hypothetical protein